MPVGIVTTSDAADGARSRPGDGRIYEMRSSRAGALVDDWRAGNRSFPVAALHA